MHEISRHQKETDEIKQENKELKRKLKECENVNQNTSNLQTI